jgi:hypothetical protein
MTGWLGRWINWTFKYGYYIAYAIAAVIAITGAFLTYYYISLYR